MTTRYNPNAQGPTAEITAAEEAEFVTPALSKSTQHAQKMQQLNSTEPLPKNANGKTSQLEYERRRHQGLCFYCGGHPAQETCKPLYKRDPAAATKAAKDAGGDGAAPPAVPAKKRNYRN